MSIRIVARANGILCRLSDLVPLPFIRYNVCVLLTFPPQVRGNKVDDDMLEQLVPGTSARADVIALLGSPTAGRPSTTTPGCISASHGR